ncbi:MAG: putative D,D-dipeptide-binding periplasmic protein DdpA precursor [Microgenomates bacterium OLB22]|nr:MAG: putative D,D-dipeptide-binding periplasmic protein DdpA precursor [Microgenomates bacterium OLB22]
MKRVRFYWWLAQAFVKKNARILLASMLVSFVSMIVLMSLYPIINAFLFNKKEVTGLVGAYTSQNLPDEVSTLLSSPLVHVTPKGEIIPIVADSWELFEGEKRYRFHLKKNLNWDDGKAFTARDIHLRLEGVELSVIDDFTLEFKLSESLNIFPVYLTKPLIREPLRGIGGLYRIQSVKFSKGTIDTIHLYPTKKDLPYRVFRFYKNEKDLITAFKRGEITRFTTLTPQVAQQFAQWNNTAVKKDVDYTRYMTLFLNTSAPSFETRDARKAVAYALPDLRDFGQPGIGPIPPVSWAFYSTVKQYPRDLKKAKDLIAAEVKQGSSSAGLTLYSFYDYGDVAEQIKSALEAAGAKIDLRLVSYIPDTFDLFLTIWDVPDDPDQYFLWHSTQASSPTNISHFKNAKIDQLLENGRKNVNVQQRKLIYKEFQELMNEELPAYFLYHPYVYTVGRK